MKKSLLFILSLSLLLSLLTGCTSRLADPPFSDQNLIVARNYDSLLKLIDEQKANTRDFMMMAPGMAVEDGAAAESAGQKNTADYSRTNIQVEGVDEADIIKTDGRYLYLINNGRLTIVDAADPAALRIVSELSWTNHQITGSVSQGETPQELFIDSQAQRLILLLSGYEQEIREVDVSEITVPTASHAGSDVGTGSDGSDAIAPDQDDEQDPVVVTASSASAVDSDESAVSSDGAAESEAGAESPDELSEDERRKLEEAAEAEAITRTERGEPVDVPAPDMIYVTRYRDYVTSIVFDISQPEEPVEISRLSQEGAYLTSRRIGSSVYVASQTAMVWMYDMGLTAEDDRDTLPQTRMDDGEWETIPVDHIGVVPDRSNDTQLTISAFTTDASSGDPTVISLLGTTGQVYASASNLYVAAWQWGQPDDPDGRPAESTMIYRFALRPGQIEAAGAATVPGSVLNQFSMDEHNGYFRIATTLQSAWDEKGEFTGSSQLHVLDSNLKAVGSVLDIAPGEMIKSARFMGERAYLVTFETVDPLFVIDLGQPQQPTILGELKIPGYSTYLHPYSDTLLLGFGYDVESSGDRLTHLGLKVSLFDVSDVTQPREHSTLIFGGSGSYSDLLYNHKSLLFDQARRMIAFPATLMPEGQMDDNREMAYMPEFSGLMILSTDENNHLTERARISQDTTQDGWYYDQLQRAVTIGETLLTTSSQTVRSYQMPDFTPLDQIDLPGYRQTTDVRPESEPAEAPEEPAEPQD